MTAWNRIAVIALVAGLAHSPVFGSGFEPFSVRAIARHLGIGYGPGYHARPCNPLRAMHHDSVTCGAEPFGYSDLTLESYDHTHPFSAWQHPVHAPFGCETCNGDQQAHGRRSPLRRQYVQPSPRQWTSPPSRTPISPPHFVPRTATRPADFYGQ